MMAVKGVTALIVSASVRPLIREIVQKPLSFIQEQPMLWVGLEVLFDVELPLLVEVAVDVSTELGFDVFSVRAHLLYFTCLKYPFNSSLNASRALKSRLFNVPSGRPSMSAICW